MSTSPTRRYYDSKPSPRPRSPPTPAEVRSQAIAKLKRAASLPRGKDGRRPSQDEHVEPPKLEETISTANQAHTHDPEHEEILSSSPVIPGFDLPPLSHGMMQRSASQSSDFHLPTPPAMSYMQAQGGQYGGLSPNSAPSAADWTAMQLAQSYLPSLSPAGYSPSPFGSRQHSSRNTPSPLPSLGDLRTLSRSNSQMARARAMDKLTGGRDSSTSPIPPPVAQDDLTVKPIQVGRLHRAGTVGARIFNPPVKAPVLPDKEPVATIEAVRPRLQRSFTVSSTNMGEERRSAVGRRMVERLAERRAAREKEEAEVRQMWEERRAAADQAQELDQDSEPESEHTVPVLQRHSPEKPDVEHTNHGVTFGGTQTLGIPERPESRETMRSNGGPFEYESHLRRSLSSRTARNAVGVVSDTEADPIPAPQGSDVEHLDHYYASSPEIEHDQFDLTPPKPSFATPSRHVQQDSTSTDGTIQGDKSPGSDSAGDGLNSMMFVLGSGSQGNPINQRHEGNWPTEVGEPGSSEWGTPSRSIDLGTPVKGQEGEKDFAGSSTVLDQAVSRTRDFPARSALSSAVVSEAESSSLSHQAMRESGMSWTEVGGPADLEVPSDVRYHKKSGSVSAKFGRTVKTAMRKRSQSRSSADSGSPNMVGEVFSQVKQTFSRRGSTSSISPRVNSTAQMSHQPSMSSLSPSLARSDSISNSALLQHEGPNREWMPRRADPDDPRIVSSKMSPFPGIAALEDKRQGEMAVPPRLIQQASDSVVPTQQRTQAIEPIYSLGLPVNGTDTSRRSSAESGKKQSWLAKTFSTPRSSGSVSRKSSVKDASPTLDNGQTGQFSPSIPSDPFAPHPLPAPVAMRRTGSRTGRASPSVSVVPEGSEDGSRLTRFTATPVNRLDQSSSPILEASGMSERSVEVLGRMESMLALGPDDPARPEVLDDPPRKLLLSTQVLQVVDTNTAKDRYLFLFNDLLVIAKPIITHGHQATLDMQFIVKSIVPLDQLHVSGFEPESTIEPERHAVIDHFIDSFAVDPVQACRYLMSQSKCKVDTATLASLIFQTPELEKTQLGNLLSSNEKLVKAFVDKFKFMGIRIDNALRIFLLSLRMPSDPNASEQLLRAFAEQYYHINQDLVAFDEGLTSALVLAMIQLNDALYDTFGFALPNHAITQEIFVSAFRSNDPDGLVPDSLLADAYSSIRASCLVQALSTHERGQAREVGLSPARLPPKLTYDIWSERIYVSIPAADPSFKIRLHGDGLAFDPPVLDFSSSSEESFRVKGTSLGIKTVLFDRVGSNAARYASLGTSRALRIERAFMQHTFQLAFTPANGARRKYCFSIPNSEIKSKWTQTLIKQIGFAKSRPAPQSQLRGVAEKVSLQVLKDAVIPHVNTQQTTPRRGSVSTTYDQLAGRDEKALGPLIPTMSTTTDQGGMLDIKTGKELVLLCRQNSLLPSLLELLSAGRDDSQAVLPPLPLRTGPGHGHGRMVGSIGDKRGVMNGRF